MKTIKISLNDGTSIPKAIAEIRAYRESLDKNMEKFMNRLLDVGIERAKEVGGRFPNRVSFKKEVNKTSDGWYGELIGDGEEIESVWIRGGVEVTGRIKTLWTMEFGTAAYAISDNRFGGGGGAGTASQTGGAYNGATDWYFLVRGEDGKIIRRHGTAIEPTRPMHNALLRMKEEMPRIAREVFNG